MPIGAYDGESVNVKRIQAILAMPVLMIICATFNAHSVWMG